MRYSRFVTSWNAVGLGAVDLRGFDVRDSGIETAIIPVKPAEPAAIKGSVAEVWRRLLDGPVSDEQLSEDDRALVRQFSDYGIASKDPNHPRRLTAVPGPWLVSFMHELVYALVAQVAAQQQLRVIFIKGPVEYRQGLRNRQHSGDVDVLVEPGGASLLTQAMAPWGWRVAPEPWEGTQVNHSITLRPGAWGCEIDVHRYYPGCALRAEEAFRVLSAHTERMSFCGVQVSVPTTPAQSVIMALHLMRPEIGFSISSARICEATDALRRGGDDAARFAREFRAEAALSEPLRHAFPEQEFAPSYEPPENWVWGAEPNKLRGYLRGLKMVPWKQRPRVAWRLLWPSDDVAVDSERHAGEEPPSSAFAAKFRRLRRGLRGLAR